ncbi:MAG: polyphosphate kinase 1 [Oscillospiraceae bacterium]|nr:polyphosphate kinase 1 [Oscillospiraceae bacterium]
MASNAENAAVPEYGYTQNRELSWLRFNRRVLEEAADETVPLLERMKYISIFTSNLDEFFMIRVGSLFDLSLMSPEEIDNKSGMTPREQLERIYEVIPGLVELKDRLYGQVSGQLEKLDICDLGGREQRPEERKYINQYFKTKVLPILSPQIVDSHHPFPHLGSKALYIAALLQDKKGNHSLGLVPVPDALPPFVTMPDRPSRFIRMEDVILQWAPTLFGSYKVLNTCVLCVTRNADIGYDEEKFDDDDADFRNRMSKLLKKRSHLSIVRLEISGEAGGDFLKLLKRRIDVDDHQIYFDEAPLRMKYVFALERALPEELARPLYFAPYAPRWPEGLDEKRPMIEQIQKRDRLLFFPFDRVDPFLRLLSEAAEREDVVSIKITIYRLASSSKIAHILCRAAENGKEVTVLMELRARFDEANNISWSRLLEDAGCRVIYGVEDFKCHSKICLITLREGDQLHYITQIGTGNYNEKTNTQYTDLSFMTAAEDIGADGTVFFQNMMVGNLEGCYDELLVAPVGIKKDLLKLIDKEIAKGPDGYICIKANSMTERQVIDKLSEASCAGVQVRLILRSICCLRPGIPGKTENIHVTSIVGRFLEHARIYCFGRGEKAKLFIASADLMTRNLNRRVEIACPIREPRLKEKLLLILNTQLADNVKASTLQADGSYFRKSSAAVRNDSQLYFMEHTIHQPEPPEAPAPKEAAPAKRLKSRWKRLFGGKS